MRQRIGGESSMGNNPSAFPAEVRRYYRKTGGREQALGMGCAGIGRTASDAERQRFQRTLDAAYEAGIRYFDTSAQYGGSEFRLGEFLRRVPRDSLFVATKSPVPAALSPQEAGWFLRQAIRDSRERLGVETIDLFQIHDVASLDAAFAAGGGLDALEAARAAGEIRYIGLGARSHALLSQAAFSGRFDTILTYRDYTPIHASAADLIARAAAQGVGVINGSPLSFGLLTGDDPRRIAAPEGETARLLPAAVRLYDRAVSEGWSPLSAALQFPLRNPAIHLTLTGPAAPEELAATLAATETDLPDGVWEWIAGELGLSRIPTPENEKS